MAKAAAADRISHILTAIQEIETNTSGLSLDEFKENRFRQLGIERCLEIICEASRHLPDVLKDSHPEIPWRRISDMGNRIRHAYHAVDSDIIWEIVVGELPDLRNALTEMARKEPGG